MCCTHCWSVSMAFRLNAGAMPVQGRVPGALERVADKQWNHFQRIAKALRSMGDLPMTRHQAQRLSERFGIHCAMVYEYRARLREADEVTALAGRTRGWKPLATRLSVKQEHAVEEAINAMRKKPGPLRVVDPVEEVGARCRLLRVACPSRPAVDRRLKRAKGVKVHRRGVASPGTADPRISLGSFIY